MVMMNDVRDMDEKEEREQLIFNFKRLRLMFSELHMRESVPQSSSSSFLKRLLTFGTQI